MCKGLFNKAINVLKRTISLSKKDDNVEYDELILSPCVIKSNEPPYHIVKELKKTILTKDVYNIALSGPYGSGKSSILKTLLNDNKYIEKLSLEISLAALESKISSENIESNIKGLDSKEQSDNGKPKAELNNDNALKPAVTNNAKQLSAAQIEEIEYSILQQILYKENSDNLSKSKFRKIHFLSDKKTYCITSIILIFTTCFIILFQPSFIEIDTISPLLAVSTSIKTIIDIISLILMLVILCGFIINLVRRVWGIKIRKVNLTKVEVELLDDTSIFNKHLEEIIYFFKQTKYRFVIFEDIDRFNNVNLFIKLRELNRILNKSNILNGRDIKFIYAIKDDLFLCPEDRTKFFDKIVVTVPYVDCNNAASKLNELINPKIDNKLNIVLEESICYGLGSFIVDMRLLKNIVSEFNQYNTILNSTVEHIDNETIKEKNKKLIGLITYKNYFPQDFAKLIRGEGVLIDCFNNIQNQKDEAIKDEDEKIDRVKHEIVKIENRVIKNIKELRTLYLRHFPISSDYSYIIDGSRLTFDAIVASDELFHQVINNKLRYRQNNYNHSPVSFGDTFTSIEDKVDPDNKYCDREKQCTSTYKYDLDEKINIIKERIEVLKGMSIDEILSTYPSIVVESPDVNYNNLFRYLLLTSLIDQSYYLYMSYFHAGQMSQRDMNYIRKIGRASCRERVLRLV